MSLMSFLADLFAPQLRCLGCGDPRKVGLNEALCEDCLQELCALQIGDETCPRCLSLRQKGKPCAFCLNEGMRGISHAYSPFHYHGIVQKLIVTLKFSSVILAAHPFAEEMARCITGRDFDAMVPVPLHASGLRQRGFNQARVLCEEVARFRPIPILEALNKYRRTKHQSSLKQEKRERNVAGVFKAVLPVEGLRILLVDDVRTSGATARACAKVLLDAGAKEVSLLTAAVAGTKTEG